MTVRVLLAAAVLSAAAFPVRAESFVVRGVEFSDELGGFRLLGVSGKGTKSDPFVVLEEITGTGTAVLVIRGLARLRLLDFEQFALGFRIRKMVLNVTRDTWYQFDLELRETLDVASDYGDGLSFDQAKIVERPFTSDRFPVSQELTEPYDGVRFTGGKVAPGETVAMNFAITDPTPLNEFYLMQTVTGPMAHAPPGAAPQEAMLTAPRR